MAKTDRDKKSVEQVPSNRKKRATLKPTKAPKYKHYTEEEYQLSDFSLSREFDD